MTESFSSGTIRAPRAMRQPSLKHIGRSMVLDEAYVPRLMRASIIIITVSLASFVAWASVTRISEVTRAEGDVIPSGYVQVVQHLEGGIVSDILVEDGQMVEKGQVLIKLNGVGATEDLSKNEVELKSLKMEKERLTAFMDGRTPDFSHVSGSENDTMSQQRFYDATVDARSKEAEIVRSQISQKRESVRGLQTRRTTLQRNLAISQESLAAVKTLLDKGLANRFRYLSQQEDVNAMRGQLEEVEGEIIRAKQGIGEYEQRLASLSANYHDQAAQELHRVENEIAQLEEVTQKTQNRVNRLDVRAPTRGLVKGLEVHTVGGVVGAGEKLLEIVPMDEQMVVEAKISTTDIGHVRVGQPVQIKVHSYDFVRYGMVGGTLSAVSPTTFIDKFNKTFYRARIVLQQPFVGSNPQANLILPGMTVEADIRTGEKSVMDYLLKPIHVAASSALQER